MTGRMTAAARTIWWRSWSDRGSLETGPGWLGCVISQQVWQGGDYARAGQGDDRGSSGLRPEWSGRLRPTAERQALRPGHGGQPTRQLIQTAPSSSIHTRTFSGRSSATSGDATMAGVPPTGFPNTSNLVARRTIPTCCAAIPTFGQRGVIPCRSSRRRRAPPRFATQPADRSLGAGQVMNGKSSAGMMTMGRIMSRSSCSRMWQWYM